MDILNTYIAVFINKWIYNRDYILEDKNICSLNDGFFNIIENQINDDIILEAIGITNPYNLYFYIKDNNSYFINNFPHYLKYNIYECISNDEYLLDLYDDFRSENYMPDTKYLLTLYYMYYLIYHKNDILTIISNIKTEIYEDIHNLNTEYLSDDYLSDEYSSDDEPYHPPQ